MPEEIKQTPGGSARPWHQVAGSKIWYFFNSLKLTLFILIAIAVVSIIGTVIEQNLPVEDYLRQYGEKWTKIILMFRFNDMYHSYWFMAFLAGLALNIIVCTFERFPPKWKSLLDHKPEKFEPNLIEKFGHNTSLSVGSNLDAAKAGLLEAFKRKKYKFVEYPSNDGSTGFYAWKGRIGRLGSDFTHISLLLILLGAIIGSFAGYKDFRPVYVGGTLSVPGADFKLRLDKFWIDYYDTGQIRQYNSLLTVIENGQEVLKKQIWVNEPLYYKGIRFYQSSYGMAWNKVEQASIAVKNKKTGATADPVAVRWNETTQLSGTPYSVKLVGYVSDFAFDEATNQVYSNSPNANNPAVLVEVYNSGSLIARPWLFIRYPGVFPTIPDSDTDLIFADYHGTMYSGLSINKDPGTNVVWVGSGVMAVGFILAFFVYHRRVWVHIRNNGNGGCEVKMGGMINKNNFVFEQDLKDFSEAMTGDRMSAGGKK